MVLAMTDEVNAGRETDLRIAVEVMGWTLWTAEQHGKPCVAVVADSKDLYTRYTRSQSDRGRWEQVGTGLDTFFWMAKVDLAFTRHLPEYSISMDAALSVLEQVRDRYKLMPFIEWDTFTTPSSWICQFDLRRLKFQGFEARASKLPLAICRVALKVAESL